MIADVSKKSAILCLGRTYCDIIFTGLQSLPVIGREVFAEDIKIVAGGGAYITAAHLAHKGCDVALVSRLGFDPLSLGIIEEIENSGLDLQFLERSEAAGPQVTVASVVGEDRAFLSRRAGGAEPSTLDAAINWDKACHLHIAEYATLHEIPDLIARAKGKGLTVSLDTSWDESLIYDPNLLEACKGVDIFFPNLEEAFAITGSKEVAQILDRLAPYFPIIALKCGADGAWLQIADKRKEMRAPSVNVVDTTGAGDAFNAGFLASWLKDKDGEAALAEGVKTGSLAVQAAGGTSILQSV